MQTDTEPMYARIERDVRRAIARGELTEGARLPSEDALCRRYGVSRMTARHAVTRLAEAGLVLRRQGAGSFVARTKVERAAGQLLGFHDDAQAHGLAPATRVLSQRREPAGPGDAARLNVREDEVVLRVRRLRFHGADPIGHNTVVVAPPFVAALADLDFAASFYRGAAHKLGVEVARADTEVEAVPAGEDVAPVLRVPEGTPLLRTMRLTYLADDRLLGLTRTLYRGDRYYLSLTIHRTEPTMSA